jgi:hypothetical protein
VLTYVAAIGKATTAAQELDASVPKTKIAALIDTTPLPIPFTGLQTSDQFFPVILQTHGYSANATAIETGFL